jgi:hypothetical protein
MSEFGAHDTAVAVWSSDFAPNDTDLAALSFFRGTIDVSYTFAEVESRGMPLA